MTPTVIVATLSIVNTWPNEFDSRCQCNQGYCKKNNKNIVPPPSILKITEVTFLTSGIKASFLYKV